MGAAAEVPTTGPITLRIEYAARGTVRFSLNPDAAEPTWYEGIADLADASILTSMDDAVSQLMKSGFAVVESVVPSAADAKLEIAMEKTETGAELVASGTVSYLPSEWESFRQGVAG